MLNIAYRPFVGKWQIVQTAIRHHIMKCLMLTECSIKIWEKKENATQTLNWKWTRPTDKAMQVHSS